MENRSRRLKRQMKDYVYLKEGAISSPSDSLSNGEIEDRPVL